MQRGRGGTWSAALRPSARGDVDAGYTLLELLITLLIMPIVIGGLAVALIAVLTIQPATSAAVSDSSDAQTVSTYFEQDVQSAANLTTSATATQCGPGTQLLGMEWDPNAATSTYETVVSYVEIPSGAQFSLVRQLCTSGASATPTTTLYISHDLPAGQAAPTVTPSSKSAAAAAGWTSTIGVTGVTLSVNEPGSHFPYTLTSVPKASTSSSSFSNVSSPTTTCGFATPGTGTYASTLCFIDFSSYNYRSTSGTCQKIVAGISNTPYSLSFCLKTSASPSYLTGPPCLSSTSPAIAATVVPCALPTYFDPPTSEAFLGNNGFYTGVPGDPALYTNAEGSTATITMTDIELLDSSGAAATNWELVTGDAESTDAGESLTWTSNQLFSLLPNTPTSPIGNACADPTPGDGLTGLGTSVVECASSVSSDKTGTVMLEAPAPTSLTVNMVGTGLEAIFVGVLLP